MNRRSPSSLLLTLSLPGALVLAGCASSSTPPPPEDPAHIAVPVEDPATPGDVPTTPEDDDAAEDMVEDSFPAKDELPSCDELRTLLGLESLVYAPDDDGDHHFEDPTRYGISCTWFTPDTFEKTDPYEVFADPGEAAGITLEISRDPADEEAYRYMGWLVEEPRLDPYGGFLVVPGGADRYDPDASVSLGSPHVHIGRFSSYISAGNGLLVVEQNQLLELTDSWAIDKAIEIYESL